jgi:O-antigen/teichoic acid export membrane protein
VSARGHRPGAPPPLRWELLANLGGAGWGAAVQIFCIPVYLALLGLERYALIAFATALLLAVKALDLGLSHTLNRELARRTALGGGEIAGARELLRTMEFAYTALGALLGGAIVLAAPLIATRWFGESTLGVPAVATTVRLIGFLVVVQWPLSLYQGALLGLRRATVMNLAAAIAASLAGGGAVALLLWGDRSLATYLRWQIGVAAAHTLIVGVLAHRALPAAARPARLRLGAITGLRATTLHIGGLTLSMLLLLQADKLLASRWLPLDSYGSYMLGAAIASGLAVLGVPVFATLLPRLSTLAAHGDRAALRAEFVRGTHLVAVLVFPAMIACALLARDLLELWTHDPSIARAAAPAAAALLVGTGTGALLQLVVALQLGTGRTRLGIAINVLLLCALLPLGAAGAKHGAVGVAVVWCALMIVAALAGGAMVVRRQLGDGALRWLAKDVGAASLAMLIVAAGLRPWLSAPLTPPLAVARVLTLTVALSLVAAATTGLLRPATRLVRLRLARQS